MSRTLYYWCFQRGRLYPAFFSSLKRFVFLLSDTTQEFISTAQSTRIQWRSATVTRINIAAKWARVRVTIWKTIMQSTTRIYYGWIRKYNLVCLNGWRFMDRSLESRSKLSTSTARQYPIEASTNHHNHVMRFVSS